MKNIKLTEQEFEYLKSYLFLNEYFKFIVLNPTICNEKIVTLTISEELADEH